ncbi:hypothetical protein ABW02_04650 [Niallia circulans]|uniref:Uncharacterized protein n=1 Tax=Niallia circulans TaxID=1397 RepID=A0A0J1INB5_NIACI|nr:hypothetical protein ABW02_04650 [Niallia circulans]
MKIGQQEFFILWKQAVQKENLGYHLYTPHNFSFKELKLYNLKDYLLNKYWDIKKPLLIKTQKF